METHTGMDVAWCLTCSKSTPDARSPYCSEACRLADCGPTQSSSSKAPLTSPVPAALYSSPPIKAFDRRRSSASPTKASSSRPPFASRATIFLPAASEAAFSPPKISSGIPRDRRAFSFPSAPNSPPLLFPPREHRGSTTLPPFARRDIIANMTPLSPALGSVKEGGPRYKHVLAKRLAKSTGGANTPGTAADSVFLSTSESSDDEEEAPARPPAHFLAPPPRTISGPGPSTQFSTLRSQLSIGRTNSLQSRSTSTSPVAAMVASSASSRSREDIISWAKAIDRRNGADDVEDDMSRGRPRTARVSSLARLPPPSTEPLDEHSEEDAPEHDGGSSGPGTTPKGRIGSALAGLTGYGMGSIVKALTSVTSSPNRPAALRKTTTAGRPGSSTSDFAVAPSPAEVAKVDVVASTMPLDDATPSHYNAGGTATLSTLSLSEIPDPSVVGTHDHVEIATDDGRTSATSSGFASRRYSKMKSRKDSVASVPPPVPERQQRPPPSARPITSTLWSLSSYFTRFSPFAISSAISPYAPFSGQAARPLHSTQPSSSSTIPTVSSTATATPEDHAAVPLPAARSRPDTPESPAQQLVRSIPMDIAMPPPPIVDQSADFQVQRPNLDRLRSSRSRARSKSRRRIRSRTSSAGRMLDRHDLPEAPAGDLGKGVGMSNQDPDADADVSDEEGGVVGRGRDRGRDRGRGRDIVEDRERGRGRGRDRSVKPV